MDDEFKELREAFEDFLQKDRDDDAAAATVAQRQAAVDSAEDELIAAEDVKQATAQAKAASRARVEELMNATD